MGISHINVHIIQTLLGKFQKKKSHFGQKALISQLKLEGKMIKK